MCDEFDAKRRRLLLEKEKRKEMQEVSAASASAKPAEYSRCFSVPEETGR